MPNSFFGGGGFFGKPVKMAPGASPLGQVTPQAPQAPAPAPTQAQSIQPATFPPKRIPMGPKGDCPICH
jgi:hypothetical protein